VLAYDSRANAGPPLIDGILAAAGEESYRAVVGVAPAHPDDAVTIITSAQDLKALAAESRICRDSIYNKVSTVILECWKQHIPVDCSWPHANSGYRA
jgi:hypothetical protein